MLTLLNSETFVEQLKFDLLKAEHSLTIISPYITDAAVKKVYEYINNKQLTTKVITLPPGKEYVTGAVEPMALLNLLEYGFEIKMLADLHAKLYIIDERLAYIGSANFTTSGWKVNNFGNKEVMTKVNLTIKELKWIQEQFIQPSSSLEISKKWVDEINNRISSLKGTYSGIIEEIENVFPPLGPTTPYSMFLARLKENNKIQSFEHISNGYGRNAYRIDGKFIVKILRSKLHDGTSKFDNNYRFAVSKKTTKQALDSKVNAFIMLLEESDDYAWLPRTFLEKAMFINKHLDRGKRAWQFQISRQDKEFYIRTKGRSSKEEVYNIANYINSIHYKHTNQIKRVKTKDLMR